MDEGVCPVEVVLDEKIVVDSVQHFHPVDLVCLVIYIHLCWMQKTKLEIEGVVFLINTVGSNIADEDIVHLVVLAVHKGEEVLGWMPKTFREAGVYWEVETL